MYTSEIPRAMWTDFFKSFSRDHEDWIVEVEIIRPDIGVQTETRQLKLEGIAIDTADWMIEIMAGEEAGDHITHTIGRPASVWIEKSDDGRRSVLKIESEDDEMTLVRFYADALSVPAATAAATA